MHAFTRASMYGLASEIICVLDSDICRLKGGLKVTRGGVGRGEGMIDATICVRVSVRGGQLIGLLPLYLLSLTANVCFSSFAL